MRRIREDGLGFESGASLTIVVVSCRVHEYVDSKNCRPTQSQLLKNLDSIKLKMLKLTKILIHKL